MKRKLFLLIIIVVICVFTVVKHFTELKSETFFAMDTIMSVKVTGSKKNLEFAEKEIKRLDMIFDAYDKNSELYELNAIGEKKVSEEMADILNKSVMLSEETGGSFDIALKNLKDLWDVNAENPTIPSDEKIKEALLKSGMENFEINGDNVTLKNGAQIDLGAIAKGYATDVVADGLKTRGVKKFLLDFGGNIYAYSPNKPMKIGIQNPYGTRGDTICVLEIEDCAVVSSGFYERNFEADGKIYHHILNPETGYPAESGLAQVTIIGKDAAKCDAYSTAIAVSGLELAKSLHKKSSDFEYIIVSENTIYVSKNAKQMIAKFKDGFKVVEI